jgi:hypothetical protein
MKLWVFVVACAVVVGCKGSSGTEGTVGGGSLTPPGSTTDCTDQGCPCSSPGATATCKVYRRSGDYVECSLGTATCQADGRWGPCEGAGVFDGGMPDVASRLDTRAEEDLGVSIIPGMPIPDGGAEEGPGEGEGGLVEDPPPAGGDKFKAVDAARD